MIHSNQGPCNSTTGNHFPPHSPAPEPALSCGSKSRSLVSQGSSLEWQKAGRLRRASPGSSSPLPCQAGLTFQCPHRPLRKWRAPEPAPGLSAAKQGEAGPPLQSQLSAIPTLKMKLSLLLLLLFQALSRFSSMLIICHSSLPLTFNMDLCYFA